MSLACFSQALVQEDNVQVCLETIREVSSTPTPNTHTERSVIHHP